MSELSNVEAIKKFFGEGKDGRPVTNLELKDCIKGDKDGYHWMADEARKILAQ